MTKEKQLHLLLQEESTAMGSRQDGNRLNENSETESQVKVKASQDVQLCTAKDDSSTRGMAVTCSRVCHTNLPGTCCEQHTDHI